MTGVQKDAMLGRGDYEYAVPFYDERRPLLADRIFQGDPEAGYPSVRRVGDALISEIYTPHLRSGRGAHIMFAATALLDRNGRVTGAIESIRDVTDEVTMEAALQNASRQLNTLSGILRTDLSNRLAVLYGHLSSGVTKFDDPEVLSFIDDLQEAANGIRRQIESPTSSATSGHRRRHGSPCRRPSGTRPRDSPSDPSLSRHGRSGSRSSPTPHLATVVTHLFENALSPATGATRIVVTYQLRPEGCAIIVEDDGTGIPDEEKERLFVQNAEGYGHGLLLAHEILAITGIAIRETGTYGTGARFELLVPSEGCRVV
ncbi:MAG: hypothetical protein PWR21_903 [Methanoculleus sp.]|nr:hypothetical protein [Methanoculleus sp.]